MATTITTTTGTLSPTKYNNQRRIAVTSNGVIWTAVIRPADSRIEFWFSTTNGSTWAEATSQRITGVKQDGGVSLRIATRADGQERLAVAYVSSAVNRVRIAFGNFASNRQSFAWVFVGSISLASTRLSHPDCVLIPVGSRWYVPVVWSMEETDKTMLYFNRWVFSDTAAVTGSTSSAYALHTRVSTLHTHPTIDVRNTNGVLNEASRDLYVAWAQGDGNSEEGGSTADPEPRQYLLRMSPSGSTWVPTVIRVLRESGVGPDPGAASATTAIFTGYAFAAVRSPRGPADNTLQLHLQDPADAWREIVAVPDLNKGEIINVGITYDPYNGDIYILANGATNQTLSMIRYQWPIRQWTAWTQVTTEGAITDSLSMKAGTSGKRIEGVYGIISSTNRAVRHELFGTVNTVPSQATWLVTGGARNRNVALTVGPWKHNDVDGDAQSAYTLERRINGGTPMYWSGVTWQSGLTNVTSAADSLALPSGWAAAGDTVEFRVRTSDGFGFGPWSAALTLYATAPVNPTILSPANAANVTVPELIVQWDVAEQSAYLVSLKTGDGVGTLWSSGWVGSAGLRAIEVPIPLVNGQAYDVEVTTQNNAGLNSATAKHDITVSLTPPPVPTYTWAAVAAQGAIDVTIANGSPGAGEAAAALNDLYQVASDGTQVQIASDLEPNATFRDYYLRSGWAVTYRIVAKSAVGAIRESV